MHAVQRPGAMMKQELILELCVSDGRFTTAAMPCPVVECGVVHTAIPCVCVVGKARPAEDFPALGKVNHVTGSALWRRSDVLQTAVVGVLDYCGSSTVPSLRRCVRLCDACIYSCACIYTSVYILCVNCRMQ